MSHWVIWTIVGLAMAGLELLTGTFYLMVLAAGAVIAALAAFFGASVQVQAGIFALCAFTGAPGVYFYRRRLFGSRRESEALQNIDAGNTVVVTEFASDGTAQVSYRGATWSARLDEGVRPEPGTFRIVRVEGAVLVVAGPL